MRRGKVSVVVTCVASLGSAVGSTREIGRSGLRHSASTRGVQFVYRYTCVLKACGGAQNLPRSSGAPPRSFADGPRF